MEDDSQAHSVEETTDNGFLHSLRKIAIATLCVATAISIMLLILENNLPIENKTYDLTKIGSWGDTVGGLLNPIFSFLALLGLLWTIRLQSNELTLSRKELEFSRAELKGSREANE